MTPTSQPRRAPLAAPADPTQHWSLSDLEVDPPASGPVDEPSDQLPVPPPPPGSGSGDQAFAEGVRSLKVGGTSVPLWEWLLVVIGGILAPLGVAIAYLGWRGASETPHVFEQIPYMISGGMIGLALVFLGGFCYFAHWMSQMVKEHRVQSTALIEAIGRLQDQVERQGTMATTPAAVSSNGFASPPPPGSLVATAKGTMAHRPECAVVAGKPGLRSVTEDDDLSACKMCDPYRSSVRVP